VRRGDLRRLERLETPTRADYVVARRRAFAWTLRSFGAGLEEHEEADLEGYGKADFATDCALMGRYRSLLDPEKRKAEQHGLLMRLYRELERRGGGPEGGVVGLPEDVEVRCELG
jgi:hypothetical protein